MINKIAALLSSLLMLLLISCSATTEIFEDQTEIPTPSKDPLSTVVSGLSTDMAQFTPTTPIPTSTQPPEEATKLAQWESYQQTQEHIRYTAYPATRDARGVKCKDGYILELPLNVSISNDQWTLFTCSPSPKNREEKWTPGIVDYGKRYTQVTSVDLSQSWIIQHDQFDYSIIDRPDALLSTYCWTKDGKHVYLYPAYYPGPDGFSESHYFYSRQSALLRLNLKTGDFKTILPDQPGAYAFALSPDDQLLVYSTSEKPELIHVVNMDSGDEQQIVIENGIGVSGRFVWDPTSTKVVFATGFGPGGDEPRDDISSTSIYILTISYMHAQPIVYQDSRELLPWWNLYADGYWIDANTICLLARSNAFRDWDGVFALNIQTGILTNAPTTTATPYPTTESQ